ncbi:hypothetical protein [Vulcanisaeta distributa]|uniref:hypothetical protein n=1 Tax=Vulcanisaeta distributa TaxID=164451 RepID=UPI000A76863B|nr:hypothetical protein [Vulcanisaeta distributa]
MDREVKVIKQVRALSNDIVKPRYKATYIIMSNEPKTVKARYVCGDEINEQEVTLSKAMKYVIELLLRDT